MTSLWSGLALVAPLDARVSGRAPDSVSGVSIDTRTLQPGDLFVAIRGDKGDGHEHVAAAFEKGAAAAVIDEANSARLKGAGPLYVVHDTLRSLEGLGRAARARTQARVSAVTGSVGKTGVKEALRMVFARAGATHASAASYNNHWGVPLTLARMPKDTRFGVFEIGMNHAGEITPLVGMVRPHVAAITTVAPVHLEHFGSLEAIADAKAEIFSGLERDGVAVVNRDIDQYSQLRDRAAHSPAGAVLTFGEHEDADARLVSYAQDPNGARVLARVMGRDIAYTLGAPGRHMAMNSLCVLLVAQSCGLEVEEAALALADFQPPAGRGARLELSATDGRFTLIDESYNANPASMSAALALLGAAAVPPLGRRVAALGDMLELGPDAVRLHRDLVADIETNKVDAVYAAGPMMKHMFDALPASLRGAWAETAAEMQPALIDSIAAGDVVMIKGSNGSRMGPVVAALKQRFAPRDAGSDNSGTI